MSVTFGVSLTQSGRDVTRRTARVTSSIGYFRLHGGADYSHVYTDEEIRQMGPRYRLYVKFCMRILEYGDDIPLPQHHGHNAQVTEHDRHNRRQDCAKRLWQSG